MRLLLAAGGTGGHVFPAIAIANAVKAADTGSDILFVGTPRGHENELVPAAGFRLEQVRVEGLKGKSAVRRLLNLARLPKAFVQAWKILGRFSPTAVFGIGGYASGPILLLASLRGFQTALLEPNVVPGFSNRLLGRFVRRVFVAFEEASAHFPAGKCEVTGNPIREEILRIPPPVFSGEKRTVLVFGGSQGARRINAAVAGMLKDLADRKEKLFFIHQTGAQDEQSVRDAYRSAGFQAEVRAFFHEMAAVYEKSDLIIARSGSSVLEIAACGRPSILVPFPFAADDHQRANARVMEKAGAAVVIEDGACDGPALAKTLRTLLEDTGRLKAMSAAALRLRKSDAARTIASELLRNAA